MYPRIMTAGPHQSVVVANEEQERALPAEYGGLAGQWPDLVIVSKKPETLDPVNDDPEDEQDPELNQESEAPKALTKAELQEALKAKGIAFKGTWGVAKLKETLDAA